MVHRVFKSSEIQCHCRFQGVDSGLLRIPALWLSRSEALLDTVLPFPEGHTVEVILELTGRRSLVRRAQVLSAGASRLRLQWLHSCRADEDRFEDVLIECARVGEHSPPKDDSIRASLSLYSALRQQSH